MRTVVYSKGALKVLGRMPVNVVATLRAKLEQYASNPDSLANNVKALQGEPDMLRLRVGDWRVIFSETDESIKVARIAPRGSAYG